VTLVEKRVELHFPAVSTSILTVVPVRLGFRFPYRVNKVSEALGVCRTCILKADEAAAVCGAAKTPAARVAAIKKIFIFIVL
jgi:hypothetical protein